MQGSASESPRPRAWVTLRTCIVTLALLASSAAATAALPTVSVVATDNVATEAGPTAATLTFSRVGDTTKSLTVSYAISGTATSGSDFTSLGTSVSIPAGAATITKTVAALQDTLQEQDETIVATIKSSANYVIGAPTAATVTLTSDDAITQTVTVAATDSVATEAGPTTGTYTFTRTGNIAAALTVSYKVGGTATSATDFATLGTSVKFAAGVATTTKTLTPLFDYVDEGTETAVITLKQSAAYLPGAANSATVSINNLALQKVTVNALATDPNGAPLHYEWRSTDGRIDDVDSPSTSWTLPPGRGIHFAYVLVSNGKGGYTERRVAVITDTIGLPAVQLPSGTYSPPSAPASTVNPFVSQVYWGAGEGSLLYRAFKPDALVYAQDMNSQARFPAAGFYSSDIRGRYVVPGLPPSVDPDFYVFYCSPDNGINWQACANEPMADMANSDYISEELFIVPSYFGRFRLADGSVCGTINEFFDKEVTATAVVRSVTGIEISTDARLSADGDFALPQKTKGAYVRVTCEGAPPVDITVAGVAPNSTGNVDVGLTQRVGLAAPVVSSMTATLNGSHVGLFLPPPTGVPSDAVPDAERFFSYQGIDSRVGACQYYRAIGAVKGCGAGGAFISPINVEDWKRTVKIGAYATTGTPEFSATFINQVDLNLTRNHHSISYGPGKTAAYVCNHLGPPSLNSTQAEIDAAIDNAVAGKNLVACVMMDYTAKSTVNGGKPFTRFLIFGPSGELLPSINLDGRREKFVPGVCVVCHGGSKYAGYYPTDGTGPADIGAHFLPYDVGNFAFSSKAGLRRVDQELAIYNLNQNVLKAGPTPAAQELIAGWYPGTSKVQDLNYLPASWVGKGFDQAYHKIFAHSCRTCHVNLDERFNFDHYDNTQYGRLATSVCAGNLGTSDNQARRHSMPNSLVTFNRFWGTKGTVDDLTVLFANFMNGYFNLPTVAPCNLPPH